MRQGNSGKANLLRGVPENGQSTAETIPLSEYTDHFADQAKERQGRAGEERGEEREKEREGRAQDEQRADDVFRRVVHFGAGVFSGHFAVLS